MTAEVHAFDPRPEPDMAVAMPHNIAVEQLLLGAILSNNAILPEVAYLRPEHFYEPVHGRIFDACRRASDRGVTASPISLAPGFEAEPDLKQVGGGGYLARLVAGVVLVNGAEEYGETILELWQRRAGISAARDAIERLASRDGREVAREALGFAASALDGIASTAPGDGPLGLRERVLAVADAAVARSKGGASNALLTGLRSLDDLMGGIDPGWLCIVAARPSMGKSSFAVSVALNVARAGQGVGFFSLEMTADQLAERALAEASRVPFTRLRRPGVGDAIEIDAAARIAARMVDLPFWIDETPGLALAELRGRAMALHRRHPLGLVVVDHIGLMHASEAAQRLSMVDQLGGISSGLKALAKRLSVPVIALCQLNRAVEGRDDKRPGLADLRASGRIEEDADQVLFLHREEYYLRRSNYRGKDRSKAEAHAEAEADARNKADIIVAKNRQGETGAVQVFADVATNRWGDL